MGAAPVCKELDVESTTGKGEVIGTKSDCEKLVVLGSESKIASGVSIAELFKVKYLSKQFECAFNHQSA